MRMSSTIIMLYFPHFFYLPSGSNDWKTLRACSDGDSGPTRDISCEDTASSFTNSRSYIKTQGRSVLSVSVAMWNVLHRLNHPCVCKCEHLFDLKSECFPMSVASGRSMKAVMTDHARRQAEKSDFWFRIKRRQENTHKMCWQESKDGRGCVDQR